MMTVPSKDSLDPQFKKLVYVRYADDWLVGIRGSKQECQNILERIKIFLKTELKLELSTKKTLITNASEDKALFLGTRIFKAKHQTFSRSRFGFVQRNNRDIRLEAPLDRVTRKLTEVGFFSDKMPVPRFLWLANDKDTIITLYNSVYRGYINYYSFAVNLNQLSSWVHYILKTSCAKLLAAKFNMKSQSKIHKTFGKDMKGKDRIKFVSAVYGLKPWNFKTSEVDVIKTLYTETLSIASLQNLSCSKCGSNYRVEMHHVRHLKDLNPKMKYVDALMAKRKRKQIPLCRSCHIEYHKSDRN
jgi:hypothetical protein